MFQRKAYHILKGVTIKGKSMLPIWIKHVFFLLFVWFGSLHSSQQFFSYDGVEPVLSKD